MTDEHGMREVLLKFPEQFPEALELAKNLKVDGDFDSIIITGMGGSAWPGEIVDAYLKDLQIPIYVNRDYTLPKQASEKGLVIASSYSGNTEETLSAFRQAMDKGMPAFAVTSGGKLKEICEQEGIPFVLIPEGMQPRCATGYILTSIVSVLSNSGIIPDKSQDILETAEALKSANLEGRGRELAGKLPNKTPLIYTSERMKPIGFVWKIKFNENSKIMAFSNTFPELNHNEITGYAEPRGFHTIILMDKEDHPRIRKRMEITKELIESRGGEATLIETEGESLLTRMFSAIYLGDWVSYHLAVMRGVDPTPVDIIEDLKKKIAE